jgi:hypothetical protein
MEKTYHRGTFCQGHALRPQAELPVPDRSPVTKRLPDLGA